MRTNGTVRAGCGERSRGEGRAWRGRLRRAAGVCAAAMLLLAGAAPAQQTAAEAEGGALTLKRAVELALRNSRDLAVARLQKGLAEKSALITRAEFLPNLYGGSGAAYTNGIPESPGGRAPAIFNITYTQEIFNPPLRGQARELQEQVRGQALAVDEVRDSVIVRTASTYLELAKVRHALELLRKEQASAQRILTVTSGRMAEGLELPIEVTRAQLAAAKVAQRILALEGREEALATDLRGLAGMAENQPLEVQPEELPPEAEQAGADLVQLALANNTAIQQAESERRAREYRLKGERGGRLPSLELTGVYSVLGRFNNFEDFFRKFQRHNFNFGLQIQIPLFSAKTEAAIALAQTNLKAAEMTLSNRREDLSAEVKQKAHRMRELDAGKEVARLELQLAQQNVGVLQAQFQEGRVNLRDVEKARLEENDRWMQYLDANFVRQQAQLDLLKTTGQIAKVFQ